MKDRLGVSPAALAEFCKRNHIRRLSLFGSVQADRARPDSDVDLLVEFEPGQEPGLLAFAAVQAGLTTLIGGRPIDLHTPRDLSRYFRDDVVRSAEVQYAQG